MNFKYETERLYLKILNPSYENAREVLDFYNRNKEIFEEYEAARPANFYTINYQKSLLASEYNLAVQMKSIRFWIYEKQNPCHIVGTICFYNIIHSVYERCETGYKFDECYWHMGYAKEAMELGILLMFEELHLHRIEAYVMPKNSASLHLLQSLGFQWEGTCRKSIRIRNNWEDHLLYSIIR